MPSLWLCKFIIPVFNCVECTNVVIYVWSIGKGSLSDLALLT